MLGPPRREAAQSAAVRSIGIALLGVAAIGLSACSWEYVDERGVLHKRGFFVDVAVGRICNDRGLIQIDNRTFGVRAAHNPVWTGLSVGYSRDVYVIVQPCEGTPDTNSNGGQ